MRLEKLENLLGKLNSQELQRESTIQEILENLSESLIDAAFILEHDVEKMIRVNFPLLMIYLSYYRKRMVNME